MLESLWNAGVPTAEIGRLTGRGKNAVIGKAHRMRLVSRPSPLVSQTAPPSVPSSWQQSQLIALARKQRSAEKQIMDAILSKIAAADQADRLQHFRDDDLARIRLAPAPRSAIARPDPLGKQRCQYPSGGFGKKVTFECSEARIGASSYCPAHHKLCYLKVS